jgi:hypothetical protein
MNTQPKSPTESRICQKRPRSRYSKPWSPNHDQALLDARQLAEKAAYDDDHECAEEGEREPVLTPRLAPRDHGGEEDPRSEVGSRHPEDGELQVPRAHAVVREPGGEVDAEEARDVGAVVLRGGADERLHEEEPRHREEEPCGRALRGRDLDVARCPERERLLLASVPAEEVPPAEGAEEEADAAEEGDEREDAPDDHVRRRGVVDERLRRPVVRVRVVVARALRGRRPRRPSEVGRELADVFAVVDRPPAQAVLAALRREEAAVVRPQLPEGARLGRAVGERMGALVVAVRPELVDRLLPRLVGRGTPGRVADDQRGAMQVVRGVVGPQIRAVTEDRPVFHEAVLEEDLLPGADVRAGEERLPAGRDDAVRDGWLRLVRPVREQPENEEAEEEDEHDSLEPPLRDEQRAASGCLGCEIQEGGSRWREAFSGLAATGVKARKCVAGSPQLDQRIPR